MPSGGPLPGTLRRAVFLDRDGVLNRGFVRAGVPHPPADVGKVEVLPGVPEALGLLEREGLALIGVSNQPDVARGTQTRAEVARINRHLMERLPLEAILTCHHDTADDCSCRKPRPGLLLQAGRDHGIDLRRSFMVGDRWSDVVAGQSAGCLTFLIDAPYNQRERCRPDYVVSNLADAARLIVDLLRGAGKE
jgi:D-glycero-D-manno-heptose 1,7-bisphosphate phosphatase